MAGVTIKEVNKSYGALKVLKGIDLEIKDGEFIVLVGPSGCGKSTLLRIIAGLEKQSSGSIFIGSKLVDKLHPSHRDTAMVFQSYAFYPHLTVEENITVPLRMRRLSFAQRLPLIGNWLPGASGLSQAITRDVKKAMEALDIGHLADRKPGQLSGGQRQRVAVGRAMVREGAAVVVETTGYMPPNKAANALLGDFYAANPAKQTAVRHAGLLRDWIAYPGEQGLAITQVIYDYLESIVIGDVDDMKALQAEMSAEVASMLPK